MTIKTRKKIFLFFLFLFFIITPIIITYSLGYKLNLTWPIKLNQLLQETGMLVVDTEPVGAKIYIDGKLQKNFFNKNNYYKTPAKIKNILPGEYEVKLELDNYWTWTKKLTIKSGQTTYAEDVFLFKNNLPLKISDLTFIDSAQTDDKKYLSILEENHILLFEADENSKIIELEKTASSSVQWSPDGKKILVDKVLFNINGIKLFDLGALIGNDIQNIKWENSSDKIYYQYKNSVGYFDFDSKTSQILIQNKECLDYLVKDNYLYLISKKDRDVNFEVISLKNNEVNKVIDLPFSPEYSILNPDHELFNIYDSKHEILYLINPFSVAYLRDVINNVVLTDWLDNNTLLYANDFELWTFNRQDDVFSKCGKKSLLTRISDKINKIAWHASDNYIIYSTDTSINILELDDREKRNITELIKFDKIFDFYLSQDGESIYFIGNIGSKTGLYRLSI